MSEYGSVVPTPVTLTWMDAARRARRRVWRRRMVQALLALPMGVGVLWLLTILRWSAQTATWWALIPVAVHVLAMALAVGLPVSGRADWLAKQDTRGFRALLARRTTNRFARLSSLLLVVQGEAALLFLWPLLSALLFGTPVRWGIGFTTALMALLLLWPATRIARAQQAEGDRLLRES